MKRTAQPAGLSLPPQGLRLRERALLIEQAPAAHLLFDRFDAAQSGFQQADRVDPPVGNGAPDLFDRAWIRNETAC